MPNLNPQVARIEQYTAVALQPAMVGCRTHSDIVANLEHIAELTNVAVVHSRIDLPVKFVTIPEGAIQGFVDEIEDWDHKRYIQDLAIDLPGPETDRIGSIARTHNTYIAAQAKVRHPHFENRFFNAAFIINPLGKIIHIYYKLQIFPNENSTAPHDVWDDWIALYGTSIDSFFPVTDTDIGRVGTLICMDGSFPETARGLAMNGAEIIFRPSYPEPYVANGMWEIQNRARALDNTAYMISPNVGSYRISPTSTHSIDVFGGNSMIVDYRGNILANHTSGGSASYSAAIINIAALREYRNRSNFGNWMKDLRTEQYRLIYEKNIYPKNHGLAEPDIQQQTLNTIRRDAIRTLTSRDVWTV